MVISNAGYGLFGAAEELTDEQVSRIIATNLTGFEAQADLAASTDFRPGE